MCALVVAGIQFSCGRFSSGVSSIETILKSGLMNMLKQLSIVVFPAAIPPETMIETLFSTAYQKYAATSAERVLKPIMSIMVNGSALNFRIVNVDPLLVISVPYVRLMRLPSGRLESSIGCAIETWLPHM